MNAKLGAVLGWKHNHAPGICTVDGVITEWPDALGLMPTPEQITAWTAEYDVDQQTQQATKDADATAHAEAKADNVVQYLRDHSLADIASFTRQQINANGVTNLATAQTAIEAIENMMVKQNVILAVLAKQTLR